MDFFLGKAFNEGQVLLESDEIRHCLKVLRHKKGDIIGVTDLQGNSWNVRITDEDWNKKEVLFPIEASFPERGEPDIPAAILIALPEDKNRIGWLVEKSCELGITHVFPIHTERSSRIQITEERIDKIMEAAVKQCGRSRMPKWETPQKVTLFTEEKLKNWPNRILATGDPNAPTQIDFLPIGLPSIIAIGPEGDFTLSEAEMLKKLNFSPFRLGSTRLRTETAAIAMASLLLNRFQ